MRRLLLGLLCLLALLPGTALAASAPSPQDKVLISGDVLVARGETVGSVVVIDGNVVVRGTVHGDLVAVNGDVSVRGVVTGDVVTVAKRATLGRRARVGGSVKWIQDRPVVAPGAVVSGKVERLTSSLGTPGLEIVLGFWLVVSLSFILGGLLLLVIAPAAADAVVRAARGSAGITLISGLVVLILLPFLAVILLFTVVGTPIGLGLLLALGPLYAIAYIMGAMLLGRRVAKSAGRAVAFLVGMVILRLLALIPGLGALVSLIATIFGLGAMFVATRRARAA
jgi:cytoskeletal protein CcmA (bactofilin family)